MAASESLDHSAAFSAMFASDPILSLLASGGSWADANEMAWEAELSSVRSACSTASPARMPELVRREALALVGLDRMTLSEYHARFPDAAGDLSDSASTISVVSVPSICSTRTSKSYNSGRRYQPAPQRSARPSARPVATPARPTRPVVAEAPKKPSFGTKSRFAALLDSDSE